MPGPARVVQHRARQRHRVGVALGEDALGLLGLGDQADGDHRQVHRLLHAPRERQLVAGAQRNLLGGRDAAGGHVHRRATARLQLAREGDRVLHVPAAVHPVGGGHAHPHRPLGGEGRAHGVEHLQRKAHAVGQAAAVGVGAAVGQRRQELVQQVAVRRMNLDARQPDARGAFGLFRFAIDFQCAVRDRAAEFRQRQLARRAVQQARAQPLLEPRDAPRHGRHRHPERTRGAGERTLLGHLGEHRETFEIGQQGHRSSSAGNR